MEVETTKVHPVNLSDLSILTDEQWDELRTRFGARLETFSQFIDRLPDDSLFTE